MAVAWVVPTGASIRKVLSAGTQQRANENTADTVLEGDPFDPNSAHRRNQLVAEAVEEVRGAIRVGQVYPLSETAGSIPPEAEYHTLMLAAYRFITAAVGHEQQGIQWAILTAPDSAFTRLFKDACEYLKALAKGAAVSEPLDPEDDVPGRIRWADSLATDEEYEAGVTEDGVIVDRNSQNMNTQ